jgi:hypothetical protein
MPIPNFVALREGARILGERAHCYFVLHQPDQALEQLTLMHDLCRLCLGAPTGEPMTLVAAMINVAVTGLYVNIIGEGFKLHAWQESQLVTLQEQLKDIHLMSFVAKAFETEPAAVCRSIETAPIKKLFSSFESKTVDAFAIMPRGWMYWNLVNVVEVDQFQAHIFDREHDSISPGASKEASHRLDTFMNSRSPFRIAARIAVPNFLKATQTTVHHQTIVNEALIACALERYSIAHAEYPELLAALVPQFIDRIPHDVINDGQLKYRRTNDGFVLYSVGWNEKDDGGTQMLTKDGRSNFDNGDWVWDYSNK